MKIKDLIVGDYFIDPETKQPAMLIAKSDAYYVLVLSDRYTKHKVYELDSDIDVSYTTYITIKTGPEPIESFFKLDYNHYFVIGTEYYVKVPTAKGNAICIFSRNNREKQGEAVNILGNTKIKACYHSIAFHTCE